MLPLPVWQWRSADHGLCMLHSADGGPTLFPRGGFAPASEGAGRGARAGPGAVLGQTRDLGIY